MSVRAADWVPARKVAAGAPAAVAPATVDLPAAIAAAKSQLQSPSEADVARAKSALAAAAAQLDRYLTPGGANGVAWKKYLKWSALQAQLKPGAAFDPKALQGVARQFAAEKPGLDLPPFTRVADALQHYVDVQQTARDEKLQDKYGSVLDKLSESLAGYDQKPTEELTSAIAGGLGWLNRSGQAGKLVAAVRQRYSAPNLFVQASERYVNALVARRVDDESALQDSILGAQISGKAHMVGNIDAKLVPSPNQGSIDTVLVGTVQSKTVGRKGPAIVWTDGTTQISASKRLIFTADGLSGLPALASAKTASKFTGIGSTRSGVMGNFVQKMASKKAYQSKSEAEYIGARHAEARVKQRIEREAADSLKLANANYQQKFRNPLVRRHAFPPLLQFSTTPEFLLISALQADAGQIGAPNQPPKIEAAHDLSVQVHETMVNNFAAAVVGGQKLTDEEIRAKIIQFRGSLPPRMQEQDDNEPWSITFAKARPVTVTFDDGTVRVTIRGQSYTSGKRNFNAMNVTATYKMSIADGKAKLVRQGDLEIFPPGFVQGKNKFSLRQQSLHAILQKKFGKLFGPEIVTEDMVIQNKFGSRGKLAWQELKLGGGWLAIGWVAELTDLPTEKNRVATLAKRP